MNPCRDERVAHLSFKSALCFRSFGVSVAQEDQLKAVTGSLAVPGCKSNTRTRFKCVNEEQRAVDQ